MKTQNIKYSTIVAQYGFSKEVPLNMQYKNLQGGQVHKIQYSLMPLDGPYSYYTISCKGAPGLMILLGGPEPTPA